MTRFQKLALAAVAAGIGLAVMPNLQADTWNKKTTLTLTEPLEVPDCCTPSHTIVLPPGDYVIVLVDSLSDRHIVRIFDKDEKNVMTTLLAIPNYRLQPTDKTVFQFWEVPAGQPKALRAWFYPGDNFGQEFAYPKQKAAAIAAFVKTPVPAIIVETRQADELKTVPLVAVTDAGETTQLVAALPMRTPQVANREMTPANNLTMDTAASAPQAMPHTASTMPLLGLAGLLSLALFAALGVVSRRRSSKT